MRSSFLFSLIAGAGAFMFMGDSATPAESGSRQPVVVELFTSEGCSSCPPADALLLKLDQMQPVPGALVVALSEHVDYWDRLGWKDPFSSPVYTQRQEAYGRRFHLDSVYTPQVVVDGSSEAVGSDSRQIQQAIAKAVKADKTQVQVSQVFKNAKGMPAITIQVEPDAKAAAGLEAHLLVALAENAVVSHVLRGENSGRKLDHVAVVRTLKDLGAIDSMRTFATEVALTGDLQQWSGKRIVAFVQRGQYGPIQGAAVRLLTSSSLD